MAKRKRTQAINDAALDRVLDDVLNNDVPVIPEFADLPRRWREAPSDEYERKHPSEPTRGELLARYIFLAFTQPSAREGLRALYLDLTRRGEPIPEPLLWWNHSLLVHGDPPVKRGPRHKVDRDVKVGTVFRLLGDLGFSREGAIARIGETMGIPEDTVRSVIRKYRIPLRPR